MTPSTTLSANSKNENVFFQGSLNQAEAADYIKTIQEALRYLNKEDLCLIVHGSSFPSLPELDTGFGSPYGDAAKQFLSYLKALGFNGIQLGPAGKTKAVDASPYVSTTFSGNPLFIDLQQLAYGPEWQGLLSEATFKSIVENNPAKEEAGQKHKTAYDYIYVQQALALEEAFKKFDANKSTPAFKKLKESFDAFCKANVWWLEKDALYEVLSTVYQNDYWPKWPDDLDRRLLSVTSDDEKQKAKSRIEKLKADYRSVFEQYQFVQWVLDCQKQQFVAWATGEGLKLVADRQVGFADRDVWAYQTLFMSEWFLGAPPDYFSKNGQAWDMPVLNPDLLFNADGSLGPAGEFLKAIFDKTFAENPGGVRIDHIIGLIDPFVYRKNKNPRIDDGAGRLYSAPDHPLLGRFSIARLEQLNHNVAPDHEDRIQNISHHDIERYAQLIRLIIESAQSHGVPINAIICEDLGTLTNPVKAVLDVLELSGVRVTEFVDTDKPDHIYRGRSVASKHWILPGSHDNIPLLRWVKNLFDGNGQEPHVRNLREDLQQHGSKASTFELPFGVINHDAKAFLLTKYAELFASPSGHVQLFFSDLFGIDGLYNQPGRGGKSNWALRVPNEYDRFYRQQLKRQVAFNLPLALHLAVASRQPADAPENDLLERLAHWGQKMQNATNS